MSDKYVITKDDLALANLIVVMGVDGVALLGEEKFQEIRALGQKYAGASMFLQKKYENMDVEAYHALVKKELARLLKKQLKEKEDINEPN